MKQTTFDKSLRSFVPASFPKRHRSTLIEVFFIAVCVLSLLPNVQADSQIPKPLRIFDQSHSSYAKLLRENVSDGFVAYKALKQKPDVLKLYLNELSAVNKATFDSWEEKERLSFLINAYNAFTLKLIVDHYPVDSIKDIGGFLSGPWKQESVKLFGETSSLDHLEHGIIREEYEEPRVHFALVCAAISCPKLRSEPFVGSRLDAQLKDAGMQFFKRKDINRIDYDEKTVYLSPIFKWFKGDFLGEAKSLNEFSSSYFSNSRDIHSFRTKFTSYDWSLNEQK